MPSRISPIVELARVPRGLPRADVAIAGGLLTWAALEALLLEGPGATPTRLLLAAGFAVPLAWRRRWPIPVLLVVAACAIVRGMLDGVDYQGAMPFPALLLASFSAALYATPLWLAVAAAPAPIFVMPLAGFVDMAPGSFITLTAWAAGFMIRRRSEQLHGARLVGVLREDEPEYVPPPGLERLGALLQESRATGLDVELVEEGARDSVPGGLQLTAYRIAQESLTNVRRHAGNAPTQLRIHYRSDSLGLEITNAPGRPDGELGAGSGRGLIGMRERARLYGGTLEAGPTPDGGFRVRAELPLDAAPTRAADGRRGPDRVDRHARRHAGASLRERDEAKPDSEPVVQLAQVPRRIPRVDIVIASGLFCWALLDALLGAEPAMRVERILMAACFVTPIALRRRWPLPAVAAACLWLVLPVALFDQRDGSAEFSVLLLAMFSAGLYARTRTLAAVALAMCFVAIVANVHYSLDLPRDYDAPAEVDVAIMSALAWGAWLAGFVIRRRAELLVAARELPPEFAREAVAAERARMARELHDVVAHAVAVISVQAGAAEELIERKPAVARGHLEAVRRSAHSALVELRRLVGVLREGESVYDPQPGLARLDDLLAESRATGLPVELVEEGARGSVPAGLDLTAYRIAQESLTNVRRHAGSAPTHLRIRYGADRLELEIANGPGRRTGVLGPGSGHGLIGMRERVRLYGGTLEAGPTPDGGFRVRADLPLERQPA